MPEVDMDMNTPGMEPMPPPVADDTPAYTETQLAAMSSMELISIINGLREKVLKQGQLTEGETRLGLLCLRIARDARESGGRQAKAEAKAKKGAVEAFTLEDF